MIDINLFWCCMPALEKMATLYAASQFLLNPIYMERQPYDDIFLSSGELASPERLALAVWTWGLIPAVIIVEEVEIEIYQFGTPGIPTYLDFWLEAEFECECICEILRFPEPC